MASGKEIRISIMSALNAAGIEATKAQVAAMSSSVQKSIGEMSTANKRHWADIKAAWDLGLSAIRTVGGLIRSALKKAFDAEYALTNFRTLLGSLDAAKEHVAELKRFASLTPLTFGDLSQASKTLLAFGADVKDVVPSLKMLGDISLGNAEKFQSLALAFGKVQSAGKLSGIELKQMIIAGFNPLVEISEKTGASMDELKKMMEEGAITYDLVAAAMKSATSEGGRFNNAMEEASKTGTGLVSTLQDNWTAAVTKFGTAFLNASKEGLGAMIQKLQELNNDGTIDVWADKISNAMLSVTEAFRAAFGWFTKIQSAYNWVREKSEQIGSAVGTTVGYFVGGGYDYWEGLSMGAESYRQSGREIADRKREAAENERRIRAEAIKRRAQEEAAEKGKEAEKSMSLEEIFIEKKRKKQEEADRKAAEKKAEEDRKAAEKKAAADKKAAERAAAERERMEAKEAARRERERQREMRNQIRDQSKVLADARQAESLAQSRVAAAESKVQQAWGWYRDRRSMAAQLKEERANAKAEAQYEKDFRRLSRRSDWRTATNLSIGDEAVRRVALAREEEAAAKKAAIETAENTKKAAEKLQELSKNLEKSLEVN